MAFMIYSIDKAIDSKYIIVKSVKEQAKPGTLVHIMDARETSDGIVVDYRVTKTKQDYVIKFDTVKQFCEWCMPSVFLARYYDKLSHKEIMKYVKTENRSFLTFHLPIIIACLALVWGVALLFGFGIFGFTLDMSMAIMTASILSAVSILMTFLFDKISEKHLHECLFVKVTS